MIRRRYILAAAIAPVLFVIPAFIHADSGNGGTSGTDAGYSGVPGEQGSCAACHVASTNGTGSVQITFPNGPFYTPGKSQHWIVTITDTYQKAFGFQLTTRQASSTGTQEGAYVLDSDNNTQVVCGQSTWKNEQFYAPCPSSLPIEYIEQSGQGVLGGIVRPGQAQYQFEWNGPSSDVGPITVYIASVAGDNDGTASGDHVYNAKFTLTTLQPGQPIINNGGVVNGASFLANSSVSPTSWVTIQGTNLANSTRPWAAADFVNNRLPTSLDGVSVSIDNKPAYVAYISPTQINAITPSSTSIGVVNVTVTNNGLTSNAGTINVQAAAPAPFIWNGPSNNYAVATRTDYSLVGPPNLFQGATTVPAKPGDTIILWCTGLGATTPSVTAGTLTPTTQQYNVTHPPTVLIGGQGATVVGAALAPGYSGLYQLVVQVPQINDGDEPIVIQSGAGANSPSGVYLTIQH